MDTILIKDLNLYLKVLELDYILLVDNNKVKIVIYK